jgi:hypothetical protein
MMYAPPGPTPPDERDRFGKTFSIAYARPLRSYTLGALTGFAASPIIRRLGGERTPWQSIVAIRLTANEVPSEESVMSGTMERNETEQSMKLERSPEAPAHRTV